jgi:hypothetical protein
MVPYVIAVWRRPIGAFIVNVWSKSILIYSPEKHIDALDVQLSETQKDQLFIALGDIHAADVTMLPKEVITNMSNTHDTSLFNV